MCSCQLRRSAVVFCLWSKPGIIMVGEFSDILLSNHTPIHVLSLCLLWFLFVLCFVLEYRTIFIYTSRGMQHVWSCPRGQMPVGVYILQCTVQQLYWDLCTQSSMAGIDLPRFTKTHTDSKQGCVGEAIRAIREAKYWMMHIDVLTCCCLVTWKLFCRNNNFDMLKNPDMVSAEIKTMGVSGLSFGQWRHFLRAVCFLIYSSPPNSSTSKT